LQEAARVAFGLRARPTTRDMGPLAEGWRPWRAIAARLLWTYYRAVKNREGVLLQTVTPAAKAATKKRGKNG
jgi:DNA-3-methyladenine glycosylase II